MKKYIFLIGLILLTLVMVFAACHNEIDGADSYPGGIDWALHIVKFKNSEYKNYVLSRKYTRYMTEDSLGYLYTQDSVYYGMKLATIVDPTGDMDTLHTRGLYKNIWIEMPNDYLLCQRLWTDIFGYACLSGTSPHYEEPCYRYYMDGGGEDYLMYNVKEYKSFIDDIYLLNYTWTDAAISLIQGKETSRKRGYFFVRSLNTDVKATRPFLEHYVIKAKSLFAYTNAPCSKIDEVFLGHDPSDNNYEHLTHDLRKVSNDYASFPHASESVLFYYSCKYDSLEAQMSQMLKGIIESGRLQEYIDYDLKYNNVEEWREKWKKYYGYR